MDVHVPYAMTFELRLRGVDVLTAQEDGAGNLEDSNCQHAIEEIIDPFSRPEGVLSARAHGLGPSLGLRPSRLRQLDTSVRILAIDFGMRRMGLAVSDALGITAQGLPTLQRTRLEDDLRKIQELTEEYSTERVIVGNPIGHGGGETKMSRHAAEFAAKLRRRVMCPVDLRDERLTSVEANRALRETGLSLGKRQRAVDRVAATLLLQSYLDFLSNERSRNAGAAS